MRAIIPEDLGCICDACDRTRPKVRYVMTLPAWGERATNLYICLPCARRIGKAAEGKR